MQTFFVGHKKKIRVLGSCEFQPLTLLGHEAFSLNYLFPNCRAPRCYTQLCSLVAARYFVRVEGKRADLRIVLAGKPLLYDARQLYKNYPTRQASTNLTIQLPIGGGTNRLQNKKIGLVTLASL